jgi:hypothetical protein
MATTSKPCATRRSERNLAAAAPLTLRMKFRKALYMPIEPQEDPPIKPGQPTEPPQESPPGSPRPEVPPPMRDPGEPPQPDELPGYSPEELPVRGPQDPGGPQPATDDMPQGTL